MTRTRTRTKRSIRLLAPCCRDRAVIGSSTVPLAAKIDQIVTRMLAIGLHLPQEEGGWKPIMAAAMSAGLEAGPPAKQLMLLNELKRNLKLKLRGAASPTEFIAEFPAQVPEHLVMAAYDKDDPPCDGGDSLNTSNELVLRRSSKLLKKEPHELALGTSNSPVSQSQCFMHAFMRVLGEFQKHPSQNGEESTIPSLQIFAPNDPAEESSAASAMPGPAPTLQPASAQPPGAPAQPLTLPQPALPPMDPTEQAALVERALKDRAADKKAAAKAKPKAKGKAKAKAVSKATAKSKSASKKGRTITDITVDGRFIPAEIRKKRFSKGCSKCRYTTGCTPSCFMNRHL